MKIIILLSILLSFKAYAISCKEIKNDILGLEYRIQNTKIENCKSCKSKSELNLDYNNTLAELIIAEGLASLGMSIESHNNALNDLSPQDITDAKKDLERLNQDLDTADLLNEGLNFKNKTSIFSRFDGQSVEDLKSYLNDECAGSTFKDSTFCSNFQNKKENPRQMKALTGFLLNDQQILQSDRERESRYISYQALLKIESEGEKFSPLEFKKSPYYTQLKELTKEFENFGKLKAEKKDTSKVVKNILKRSKSLKKISANFHTAPTADRDVTNFIKNKFHKTLSQLDLPSVLLEGKIKDNFLSTALKIDNDLKLREKSLNSKFSKYLSKKNALTSGGLSIKSACNGKYGTSCLRKLCGETSKSSPKTCENFQSINLDGEYQELKAFDNQKQKISILHKAQACMNIDQTLDMKQKCLKELQTTKTPIGKLREKLKRKLKKIKDQSKHAPFPALYEQKALAIRELNSNFCRQNYDLIKYNGAKVDCPQSSFLGASETALNLGIDGEQIMIKLKHDKVKQALASTGMLSKKELNKQKNELKKKCRDGSAKLKNLCRHYQKEESFKTSFKNYVEKKSNVVYVDDYVPEDEYGFGDAAKAFFPTFMQGLPYVVENKIGESIVRQDTKSTLRSIDNYNTIYMDKLNKYRAWQDENPNANSTAPFAFNFGPNNMTTSGITDFQLDANLNNNLYSNSTPFSTSYTPIPMMRFSSGINSSTQNEQFKFKF